MCRLCEGESETNQTIAEGMYVVLNAGIDEDLKLYFEAIGESYTDRYYPKYCPECGRKLQLMP